MRINERKLSGSELEGLAEMLIGMDGSNPIYSTEPLDDDEEYRLTLWSGISPDHPRQHRPTMTEAEAIEQEYGIKFNHINDLPDDCPTKVPKISDLLEEEEID